MTTHRKNADYVSFIQYFQYVNNKVFSKQFIALKKTFK